ncbi:hypothetical protein DMN91_006115 [Ooceraea biroi]|uniref:Uncharacterized protein n=1 Tax=Ooceraea biroi TaxID=2015173 RepID=A0A3L8DPD0_OOCBI|nr:hypothetical protein DMN91_006115 [Ooceraea biroi]
MQVMHLIRGPEIGGGAGPVPAESAIAVGNRAGDRVPLSKYSGGRSFRQPADHPPDNHLADDHPSDSARHHWGEDMSACAHKNILSYARVVCRTGNGVSANTTPVPFRAAPFNQRWCAQARSPEWSKQPTYKRARNSVTRAVEPSNIRSVQDESKNQQEKLEQENNQEEVEEVEKSCEDFWKVIEEEIGVVLPVYLKNLLNMTGFNNNYSIKSFEASEHLPELETFARNIMSSIWERMKRQNK